MQDALWLRGLARPALRHAVRRAVAGVSVPDDEASETVAQDLSSESRVKERHGSA